MVWIFSRNASGMYTLGCNVESRLQNLPQIIYESRAETNSHRTWEIKKSSQCCSYVTLKLLHRNYGLGIAVRHRSQLSSA